MIRVCAAAFAASVLGSWYTLALADGQLVEQFVAGVAWSALHVGTVGAATRVPRRRRAAVTAAVALSTAMGSTVALWVTR